MKNPMRAYRLDCWLGALGAALMLVGDLCLSVIPAGGSDSGLFLREAYLSGNYPAWRLPLLLATGLTGMALGFFTVRAAYMQIKPQYRRTRLAVLIGGVIYLSSAGALHLLIGSLADWTSTLAPLLGRMETAELIQAQYDRVMPAMLPAMSAMDDWGGRIAERGTPVLVIIEGLTMYLSEAEVQRIFAVIAGRFDSAAVFVETMNPTMAKRFKEKSIEGSHAKFTWGVRNGAALAALLPEFRLIGEHSLTEGMAAFVPVYRLLDKLPAIRNLSNKIIVLERK